METIKTNVHIKDIYEKLKCAPGMVGISFEEFTDMLLREGYFSLLKKC